MRTSILIAIFLAVLLTSTAAQTCTLNAAVSSFASANSSCSTSGGCVLTAGLVNLLSGLGCVLSGLTGAVNLAIEPSGSGNLNIDLGASAASLFGSNGVASITLTANAGVNLVGVINSVTSIAGDVALTGAATLSVAQGVAVNIAGAINAGANSTVTVAQAAVVNVGSGVNVAATATLVVAGNVSATGAAAISGTVRLAGSKIDTALQTAWIKASSITVSGATSLVAGNGGFDGDVSLSTNATVNAGNSPGTVYVAGNLNMDATTTLQIEVAGTLNYDRIIVRGTFNRNGILYVNFIDNYLPNSDTTYNFGAHANANGEFNIVHGNYFDRTATRISAQYGTVSTNALYNGASSASASLAALLIPVVALLFASM